MLVSQSCTVACINKNILYCFTAGSNTSQSGFSYQGEGRYCWIWKEGNKIYFEFSELMVTLYENVTLTIAAPKSRSERPSTHNWCWNSKRDKSWRVNMVYWWSEDYSSKYRKGMLYFVQMCDTIVLHSDLVRYTTEKYIAGE